MSALHVLLVDDDADLRASTEQALDLAGLQVEGLSSPEMALERITAGFAGVVITDIRMPDMDGLTLMTRIHEIDGDIPVILITGHGDVPLAVRAMRDGAHDFIEKPFSGAQLATIAARALNYRQLVLDNRRLRAVAGQVDDLEARLVGRSNAMIALRRQLRTVGPSDADVLIIGDTGTGKEVVARALHDMSARAARPFVAITCSALPDTLIESELFGHEAGAFPGAIRARMGKFDHARGGTVLLDDIGAMPLALQGKLLRVLQDRVITPLGSNVQHDLDLRFIATSRVPLEAEVSAGRFRADLLYRLNAVSLRLPPLSERVEDIPALFARLLSEACARHRLPARTVSPEFLAELARADWPGNVRELRNVAERHALGLERDQQDGDAVTQTRSLAEQVAAHERKLLVNALIRHKGVLKPVYESMGLSRKALYDKLVKHGIDKSHFLNLNKDGTPTGM
ncbi:sigma-54-dependent transcriptional regulator [Roseinatronobacter bogoriensis]|uniref:Nif-specific regulatory protein n=1 Tax=Roseinatronobacter bogoriensis subsp. barguzinensis TaxID=441209 RepID=A0A2K8KCQ3_9RHOB|nr:MULTISPECIES: sigma-54 dependent transcriptional regulator [Rhodobaca]ATX67204.1 sigma-54-dependent Fis family transcriptional regulator [Rhodobaca barguzinensis]MBB4206743.1 two-component system C4-dicarboxylate transport response regulator DctD [Rhodobaca bogoriensis DSM 18756]TDW41487.1 two-component system C4-dicarboxylate transport response regulator DctD [Rhodobaca barguzinensis]TDY74335.1 two-component system C4-dicarboxylate transport response regulator DctD [Rhodobaca bogoriensis DS